MTGKFKSLSTAKKWLVGTGAFVAFITMVNAISPPPNQQNTKELIQNTSQVKAANIDAQAKAVKPVVAVKTEEETIAIPYTSSTENDPALASGKTIVAVAGVNGEKVISYKVTYTDGVETSRELAGERVTLAAVNEVKKVGTKIRVAAPAPASNCSPNYSGCVPIASDVDCAGGTGNGPAYASGPISVIGVDIYDLDRDGNGIACE